MFSKKADPIEHTIRVMIPLTKGTEKTRIKKRTVQNEYGAPVATKKVPFCQNCYVEWQIGYDVDTTDSEKLCRTTLPNKRFIGANGKIKALYELSEYIDYFYQWGVISQATLEGVREFLLNLDGRQLLDVNSDYAIERSHPIPRMIFDVDFELTRVKYPLLIHRFESFEVITEIKISERQYAVGVQPMLYLCFPITELIADTPLLDRTASIKENAEFLMTASNISVFVEIAKIFGILSENHRQDILSIINVVLQS
jgi:hypothetical protein